MCGFVWLPPELKNKYTERNTSIRRQVSLKRKLRLSARRQAGCAYWRKTSQREPEHSGCLQVKVEARESGTHCQCPESLAPKQLKIITTAEGAVLVHTVSLLKQMNNKWIIVNEAVYLKKYTGYTGQFLKIDDGCILPISPNSQAVVQGES